MDARRWHLSLGGLRVLTLVAPPLALILLWITPKVRRREKVLGSIGIPLVGLLHFSAALWGLHAFFGIDLYEWRGGYYPSVTLKPTRPDYDELEAHRRIRRGSALSVNRAGGTYWTGFRGPDRDGVYAELPLGTSWETGLPKALWRQPCGGGYASFAVAGGVAFTIEQRRSEEVVVAYEVQTGRELWTHGWEANFRESIGGDGPRATPTWHENRVYAQGAAGELRCLDAATGTLVWRHDILKEHGGPKLEYGCCASPLVVDDLLVTQPGGTNGQSVVAYDRRTGALRWSVGDDRPAYVSPMLVTLAKERQILVVGAKRTLALAPGDGRQLWEFAWGEPLMGRNVAQPVIWNGDRFLLSAGYDVGCVAVAIERTADGWTARELWRNRFLKNKFSSSVFWQGHVYGLDEDILTCLDAATGARQWKDGRYGYGQVLLAGGQLVILCGNGDLAFVRASSQQLEEIARIPAIEGKTWNYPAIADGKLLIRNLAEMACLELIHP